MIRLGFGEMYDNSSYWKVQNVLFLCLLDKQIAVPAIYIFSY
jgi:hypothetical protein